VWWCFHLGVVWRGLSAIVGVGKCEDGTVYLCTIFECVH
jgi:hypothetical protein